MTSNAMSPDIERRLIAAFERQQRGLVAEAEQEYRRILVRDRKNVHALNLLGVICLNSQRPDEAISYIEAALDIEPDDAEARANLGLACRMAGKLDEAEQVLRRAIRMAPHHAATIAILGCVCLDKGNPHEAIELLSAALRGGAMRPEWLCSLSMAFCEVGQVQPAITAAQRALEIAPDMAQAYVALGNALTKACEFESAIAAFGNAQKLDRSNADAWIGQGTALKEAGRGPEAEEALKLACTLFPNEPRCHFTLGTLFEQSGDARGAEQQFRASIRANPAYGPAYFQLLQLPGAALERAEQDQLELLVDPKNGHAVSAHAHFAMARIEEKQKQYAEAMRHYVEGHRLLDRHKGYDDATTEGFYGQIAQSLTTIETAEASEGNGKPTPIFVLGMPRSGTTLVEQILSAHPDVGGAGESSFLEDCVRLAERMTGKAYPFCVAALSPQQVEQLAAEYLARLQSVFSGKSHIVDKTPMNFQYIGLIKRILPNAKVIHCRRDALETCLSIFRLPFDPSQSYAHDLEALGRFYCHYQRLMAETERQLPSLVQSIDLDALIDSPVEKIADLCTFAGLTFGPAMLRFHEADRLVRTPSALQVRKPLARSETTWGDRFGEAVTPLVSALAGCCQKL